MTPTTVTGPISRIDPAVRAREQPLSSDVLRLDSNEGLLPPRALLTDLANADPELLRRYRDTGELETALATRFGVPAERVMVTAGADEAIDRACRAFLERGRTMLLPDPTFELFERFAALAGGDVNRVPWPGGPFPSDAFVERLDARTGVVVVVSPNNPTGAVATLADVRRLATAAPGALLLLDHAYVEYADDDLTGALLDLANVLVVRTFSKAWGLAGCRVGYAIGSSNVVSVLRAAGGPYPVASPSIALALRQLERGDEALRAHVARVREERATLSARLVALGLAPLASQANFVLVDFGPGPGPGHRAAQVRAGLAALGVLVRGYPQRRGLETALRITLPGDTAQFERLCGALDTVLL
jgi:histidinol-phosphate aminotransferase